MRKKKFKLLIILLLIIGTAFLCFPIIKNTVTILKIKNTVITHKQEISGKIRNEPIIFPTIEDYLAVSPKNIGEAAGYLSIPAIEISTPLFIGLDNQELLFGAGMMYPERKFETDNVVIIGHHLGIKDLLFGNLVTAEAKMPIEVIFLGKVYSYRVTSRRIVNEKEIELLNNTFSPRLTLITCDKPDITDKRIVVTAEPEGKKEDKDGKFLKAKKEQEQRIIRKNIVKYSAVPIAVILIVLLVSSYCIWRLV